MQTWIVKMEPGQIARYRRYKMYVGLLLFVVLLAVWSYP